MQKLADEKKDIELLIKKLESTSEGRINRNLITGCYNILNNYKKPLFNQYPQISAFCSKLRVYSEGKHHFPDENLLKNWKAEMIKYFTYINKNIESFFEP
jgi:hypothetical protein